MSARALTSEFQTAWCLCVCPRISPRIAGAGRSIRCFVRGRHMYQYESPVSRLPVGIANRINERCSGTRCGGMTHVLSRGAHKGGAPGHHRAMGGQGNDSSQASSMSMAPPRPGGSVPVGASGRGAGRGVSGRIGACRGLAQVEVHALAPGGSIDG